MKKMVALIMAGISLLAMSLLGGCSMDKDYEEGYFIYRKSSADTVVALVGLTELGHEQKVIVMPETVAGYKYVIIDSKGLFGGVGPADWGENETVEKIYFQNQVEWTSHSLTPTFDTFRRFHSLKKFIYNNSEIKRKTRPSKNYNVYSFFNDNDKEVYQERYIEIGDEEKKGLFINIDLTYIANIEFVYNYEGAPNEGYYWIDDVEDGEKVEIIPPDPKRDSYTFGGWYTEPECENEWDFNTVINKPEPLPTDYSYLRYYPENPIYFIYAKWIEN